MIHPSAIIHPGAMVDRSVSVGPGCVIDKDIRIGPDNVLGPHVYMTGRTEIGAKNIFHAGCVIGDAPQDVKYDGQPTELKIGNGNIFREHVTVHRSNKPGEPTVIGNRNFLMVNSHVGHNSVLGDDIIIANGSLIGGHVKVEDRAFISGNCLIHQFVRVGRLSLMQGGAGISKDLPPFCLASGINQVSGLNVVGLRRAAMGPAERLELRKLYQALFRSGERFSVAVDRARKQFVSANAKSMFLFLDESKRGICADSGDELSED